MLGGGGGRVQVECSWEFLAPPNMYLLGKTIRSGGGRCWLKLLVNLSAQGEPLEAVSSVGNSEGEQRKWTRLRMNRRTQGAQAEQSGYTPGLGRAAGSGVSEGI